MFSSSSRFPFLAGFVLLAASPATVLGAKDSFDFRLVQTIGSNALEASDPTRNREFGDAMTVDGNVLLATMPAFSNGTGRVAIFTKKPASQAPNCDADSFADLPNPPTCWDRTGSLDPTTGDSFNGGVALGQRWALVSAKSGTYVYARSGSALTLVRHVQGQNGVLAVGNDEAFIGTSESVLVYFIGKHGEVVQVQTLTTGEGIPGVGFGSALALSGNTLVVGAPGDDEGRGAVYVFRRQGGARWVKQQKLLANDGKAGDGFAGSVAIDGGLIAVGADGKDETTPACNPTGGAIYVFSRVNGAWAETQLVAGPCFFVGFGESVALKNQVLVGTMSGTESTQPPSAAVYVRLNHQFTVATVESGNIPDDRSAITLALSQSTLFLGFPRDREDIDPGVLVGHANIYECRSVSDASMTIPAEALSILCAH